MDALKEEGDDAEAFTPCDASKTAIVVYGEGAGTTRTVCTDPIALYIIRGESFLPIQRPKRDSESSRESKRNASDC